MNLKKALKHDVEVAGKAIPTMLIAALFLVGGGSAALLTSFGTVSGTADVDQAVTLDQETFTEGSSEAVFGFDKDQISENPAGQTYSDTYEVSNNADVPVRYDLDVTGNDVSGISVNTEHRVKGSGVIYDPADYSANVPVVSSVSELRDAVNNAQTGDVISLEPGTYDLSNGDGLTIDTQDVKLVSESGPEDTKVTYTGPSGTATIQATASGVEISGLTIERVRQTDESNWAQAVKVTASDVLVSDNVISYDRVNGDQETVGVAVLDQNADTSGVSVENNEISGAKANVLVATYYSNQISGTNIAANTITGEGDGVVVKAHDGNAFPVDTAVENNNLDVSGEDVFAPGTDEGSYAGDTLAAASPEEVSVAGNWWYDEVDTTLKTVDSSYSNSGTVTIAEGTDLELQTEVDFALNIEQGNYEVSVDLVPDTSQEEIDSTQ